MNNMKEKGFTIVEVLVVVSIILLLASIIMTGLVDSRARARDSKLVSEINQISKTLAIYRVGHDGYPAGAVSGGDEVKDLLEVPLAEYFEDFPELQTDNVLYFSPCENVGLCGSYASNKGYVIRFATESLNLGLPEIPEGSGYYLIGSTN